MPRKRSDAPTILRITLSGLAHLDDEAFRERYPDGWDRSTIIELTKLSSATIDRHATQVIDDLASLRLTLDARRSTEYANRSQGQTERQRKAAEKKAEAKTKADADAKAKADEEEASAAAERLRERLGLNEPLPVQYWRWLSSVLRGDFGNSFLGPDVTQLIGPALWPTIKLQGSALLLSLTVSIPVGILSAIRQHSLFDNLATTGAFLGISLPDFWFALLLQLLFAVTLGWLPSSGMGAAEGAWSDWRFLILPTLILAMARMASFTRFMRTSMLDVLGQDYLTTARAKGLDQLNVIRRHALRNALIPMITAVGLALPRLLGGAVIVESVFAWPGLGKLAVDSVLRRDTPVILALVMLTGAFVLVVNLVVDVLYAVIDPRITS